MRVAVKRRTVMMGEGPCMECLECGVRGPFDLKLTYRSFQLGVLGCAHSLCWWFQCRACREEWRVKRRLVRDLEREGVPISFLERDGLLTALALLAFFLLLLRL